MASADQYLRLAASQIGAVEQPPGSNRVPYSAWYGYPAPWCQMFQNWLHARLGMTPPGYDPRVAPKGSAYTPTCASWFKQRGRWSTRPARGALVYFDFPGDGVNRISHVGVVEQVRGDGSIVTIEGNTDEAGGRTGGKVMRKLRSGSAIVGYGMPAYQEDDMEVAEFKTALRQEFQLVGGKTRESLKATARWGADQAAAKVLAVLAKLSEGQAQLLTAVEGLDDAVLTDEQVAETAEQLKAALQASVPQAVLDALAARLQT